MNNPYIPVPVLIDDVIIENEARDIKTFKVRFVREDDERGFAFLPGQFAELSLSGKGECPIGIASSPTEEGYLLFTVKRVGVVTTQLHRCQKGDSIGLRGPFGNTYPFGAMENKNIVVIGGGFAFTTLRSTLKYMLHSGNRDRFKDITLIYGARTPGELLYKDDLWAWEGQKGLHVHITVDKGDDNWKRREGFVPAVVRDVAPASRDSIALVCGPPVMIKFTLPVLSELGFSPDAIFLSLEMRMKCGIGKCGRCNIGHQYVCKDGPVFSFAGLQKLPPEF